MKIYQNDDKLLTCLEVGDLDVKVIVDQGCSMWPLAVDVGNIRIEVVKRKLRHIENFKSLRKLYSNHHTEVARNAPPTGAQGENFIEKRLKQSKEVIDWL